MASYPALTVVSGTVITSAWGNNVRDSVLITCTSTTRPGSPTEGMLIDETDTDRILVYSGSAWVVVAYYGAVQAFTVTIQQSFNVAAGGFSDIWYRQVGNLVTGAAQVNMSANGATGFPIYAIASGLPAPAVNGNCVGSFYFFRGGSGFHAGVVSLDSATFSFVSGGFNTNVLGATPSFALLAGDRITWSFEYRTS